MQSKYQSFKDFYPFYLEQHRNQTCRQLHFWGSTVVVLLVLAAAVIEQWWYLGLTPVAGYGFAWVGHFFFEKNRPATFSHPLYSLMGDWVMYKDMLVGKLPFQAQH
ncbi:Mpo1-like protein [Gallaecimonas pentaromativorans]|uniref:Mpo1-like protein n=1 Tax=Gallaecimonas pentaromativorans TaxID=584787 RepID=UPI003A8E7F5D